MDPSGEARKPWYEKGLRFQCQHSGRCCTSHGEYQYVYLSDAEVDAIASFLELSEAEFRARWCRREDGWTRLHMDRPACPFLTEDRRCAIWPVRPTPCATWPFWRENLVSEAEWGRRVARLCPGAGRGTLHELDEIERRVAETDAHEAD